MALAAASPVLAAPIDVPPGGVPDVARTIQLEAEGISVELGTRLHAELATAGFAVIAGGEEEARYPRLGIREPCRLEVQIWGGKPAGWVRRQAFVPGGAAGFVSACAIRAGELLRATLAEAALPDAAPKLVVAQPVRVLTMAPRPSASLSAQVARPAGSSRWQGTFGMALFNGAVDGGVDWAPTIGAELVLNRSYGRLAASAPSFGGGFQDPLGHVTSRRLLLAADLGFAWLARTPWRGSVFVRAGAHRLGISGEPAPGAVGAQGAIWSAALGGGLRGDVTVWSCCGLIWEVAALTLTPRPRVLTGTEGVWITGRPLLMFSASLTFGKGTP